jgi:predicted XRE-type DNA-binding protein
MTDKVIESSGNVFEDLGFAHPAEEQAKAQLVRELRAIIKSRRLTQVAAGEIIGLSQSNLSNLLRGRTRGYTVERLCRFIMALDRDIEIRIKKRPRSRHESRFEVRVA